MPTCTATRWNVGESRLRSDAPAIGTVEFQGVNLVKHKGGQSSGVLEYPKLVPKVVRNVQIHPEKEDIEIRVFGGAHAGLIFEYVEVHGTTLLENILGQGYPWRNEHGDAVETGDRA